MERREAFRRWGEEATCAATHELREETGLAATGIAPLGVITPEASLMVARVALFAAMHCASAGALGRRARHGAMQFCTGEDVAAMSAHGRIENAPTLISP